LEYTLPRCFSTVFSRDEQPLGDLDVAEPTRGHLGNAAFAGGKRVQSGEPDAPGTCAHCRQLVKRPPAQEVGTAAVGKIEAVGERLARFGTPIAPAQCAAEVDEGACLLEPCGRACQRRRRGTQRRDRADECARPRSPVADLSPGSHVRPVTLVAWTPRMSSSWFATARPNGAARRGTPEGRMCR
jgi:hypothetical protein